MTKFDLQTLVLVLDAAQNKGGIIHPDALGACHQARMAAINMANCMTENDTLGIVSDVHQPKEIIQRAHTRPAPVPFEPKKTDTNKK